MVESPDSGAIRQGPKDGQAPTPYAKESCGGNLEEVTFSRHCCTSRHDATAVLVEVNKVLDLSKCGNCPHRLNAILEVIPTLLSSKLESDGNMMLYKPHIGY